MNDFLPLPLHDGEFYVAQLLRDDFSDELGPVFPAAIRDLRSRLVRPLFRREVIEQISQWFAVASQTNDNWADLCHFEGDTLVHFRCGHEKYRSRIRPDVNGLYPLGDVMDGWFHSAPSTPDADAALLADRARLEPQPGERLVRSGWDDRGQYFPAVVGDQRWNGWAVPRFRREVAEVVVACSNDAHRGEPDGYDCGYWAGDNLVLVDSLTDDGGLAQLVKPSGDGRYCVGGCRWTWALVPEPTTGSEA